MDIYFSLHWQFDFQWVADTWEYPSEQILHLKSKFILIPTFFFSSYLLQQIFSYFYSRFL